MQRRLLAIAGGLLLVSAGAIMQLLAQTGHALASRASVVDRCLGSPTYVVYRTPQAPEADGHLESFVWDAAPWMSEFVDMAGDPDARPPARTRTRMLWDDRALYVAADLEEPHVWATLTQRDTSIYLDNAFEVFADPNGDTHNYYELEVNALGTIWDLMLLKPYRDGGPRVSAWDIRGLEVGVAVNGTLNDPSDLDEGWTVEMAIPWSVLAETAPEARRPEDGEQWRVNLSRSHWPLDVVDGAYRKRPGAPAEWSVWSPQGEVDIHKPECWGIVQFSDVAAGAGSTDFVEHLNDRVKSALRRLYYLQRVYYEEHGEFADDLSELEAGEITVEGMPFEPELRTTQSAYEITSPGANGTTVHIRDDGRVWTTVP